MPKGGKKGKAKGFNGTHLQIKRGTEVLSGCNSVIGSDDCDSTDVASLHSITSSRIDCDVDDINCNEDDCNTDDGFVDDFEEKLLEAFDGTTNKSLKSRCNALQMIKNAFTTRFMFDFIVERKLTITDILERSLKRGKGEEQGVAAILSTVVCITLGPGMETDSIFKEIENHLLVAMLDPSALPSNRSKCSAALGLCCFIAGIGAESIDSIMDALHSVFSASFYKGNGVPPVHNPEITALHSSALLAWTLLLTIQSASLVLRLAEKHMKRVIELLDSPDVDLRIAAGEAIAVLHEISRECDEDFEFDKMEILCDKLRDLATDSQKFRAKKERRIQRSSFRDILRAVEDREAPNMMIKFGRERLMINSWSRKRQYEAFCQVLGSGMNLHLTENELLRDIFELGPPIDYSNNIAHKTSKFERHMGNIAASKARTKSRNKLRDKRADVIIS
ncbi:interferon-related developmental regulator 1-like isoform X1 [Dinothrombium tinctorium]|uniref:Interferon-related developmental regulator 1-like isoform X1 n=1 Tax=Dinothrombium tinctorium TaxID=1965070 RepID=A0A3S4REE2_9ACAR|nr:interferon-related developmental regulator 1-like isoform X1 [Dinothrombium tinctorium]